MKNHKLFFPVIIVSLITSCNNAPKQEPSQTNINSFEVRNAEKDTINRTVNNLRQGHWVITDSGPNSNIAFTKCANDSPNVKEPKNMTSLIVLEEGDYKDNKKVGLWTYYNNDGSVDTTINFIDGLPAK